MGLVDGNQPQPGLMQQGQTAVGEQALGSHIEQLQLAPAHLVLHRGGFLRRQGGVEIGSRHAQFAQRGHLVLHQGDERRDDHGHAVAHQGGNLVAERLAAPGGHQDQRIATAGHVLDDVVLHAPEGGVAEHAVQDFFRAHGECRQGWDGTGGILLGDITDRSSAPNPRPGGRVAGYNYAGNTVLANGLAFSHYDFVAAFLFMNLQMSLDTSSELRSFVDEHPTMVVADLWRLMNEAPSQGRHADFDLIAEGLLRVILCEEVPVDVQTAARELCQAYAAQSLRTTFGYTEIRLQKLH